MEENRACSPKITPTNLEGIQSACNHYFAVFHALKNEAHKEEAEDFELKNAWP